MGVYCYRVETNPKKTDLGFNFHLSMFCYKYGCNTDWLGTPSTWLRLTNARLDRVQNLFDNDPSRWSGYIGSIATRGDGKYSDKDDKVINVGDTVSIFKRDNPTSNYDDIDDPGTYLFTIKKLGRGKWKKVINECRRETQIPEVATA